MDRNLKSVVYSSGSVEFVTVAVQYCLLVESADIIKDELTDKLTKMLPLLYLKTTMIPTLELENEAEMPEVAVNEDDYSSVFNNLFSKYGSDDAYLEVFVQDMKYSDTPISESIAENLTDIYQDLKNCVTVYERGIAEHMNDALSVCIENFKTYWGQKLVNVLRALHSLKYSEQGNDPDNQYDQNDDSDLW